jgi:hypothetical protein
MGTKLSCLLSTGSSVNSLLFVFENKGKGCELSQSPTRKTMLKQYGAND